MRVVAGKALTELPMRWHVRAIATQAVSAVLALTAYDAYDARHKCATFIGGLFRQGIYTGLGSALIYSVATARARHYPVYLPLVTGLVIFIWVRE